VRRIEGLRFYPTKALDATDWVFSIGNQNNAASLLNVGYDGTLGVGGAVVQVNDSNALLYLGSVDGVNTGRITTNIAAATAGATAASAMVKVYPQNALDAADWVFSLGTGAN